MFIFDCLIVELSPEAVMSTINIGNRLSIHDYVHLFCPLS
jgi:hypothetical protein